MLMSVAGRVGVRVMLHPVPSNPPVSAELYRGMLASLARTSCLDPFASSPLVLVTPRASLFACLRTNE
jgi:hypothetical protein